MCQPTKGLLEVLEQVPDPRGRKGRRHSLSAMLAVVVCSTLCGFRGLRPLQQWLTLHGEPMWHLLGFTRRPPTRQAFANLLAKLDSVALETVLLDFIGQLALGPETASANDGAGGSANPSPATPAESLQIEIWDGKVLRGTRGMERTQQLLVRLDLALRKVLSSHMIPADTNEPKAALELIRGLVLKDRVVVADAAFCQQVICQELVDQGADYIVTVKDNQPRLKRDIEQAFVISRSFSPLPTA